IGLSSQSFPATYQRTAYVAVTRGKEAAQLFTDDRAELLKAVARLDDPMSATDLASSANGKSSGNGAANSLALARRLAAIAEQNRLAQHTFGNNSPERGLDHDR